MLSAKERPRATGAVENQANSNGKHISPASPASVEPLATIETWAAALVVSKPTIERMRNAKKIPPPDVMIGRLPRWRPSTVRAWIESGGGE